MGEIVTVRVWVRTNKNGSECEDEFDVDRAEWDGMTEDEREEMARQVVWNMAEWGFDAQPNSPAPVVQPEERK